MNNIKRVIFFYFFFTLLTVIAGLGKLESKILVNKGALHATRLHLQQMPFSVFLFFWYLKPWQFRTTPLPKPFATVAMSSGCMIYDVLREYSWNNVLGAYIRTEQTPFFDTCFASNLIYSLSIHCLYFFSIVNSGFKGPRW